MAKLVCFGFREQLPVARVRPSVPTGVSHARQHNPESIFVVRKQRPRDAVVGDLSRALNIGANELLMAVRLDGEALRALRSPLRSADSPGMGPRFRKPLIATLVAAGALLIAPRFAPDREIQAYPREE